MNPLLVPFSRCCLASVLTLWLAVLMAVPFSVMANDQDNAAVRAPDTTVFSLVEAVGRAAEFDPEYKSAQYAEAAGREFETLGRAALLPSLQLGGNLARNRQDREISQGSLPAIDDRRYYESTNLNLRLIQPLFSLDNYGRYKDGVARTEAAGLTFRDETQTFIARVVGRYVEVLAARRRAELVESDREGLREQRKVAAARFDVGDGTRLELAEIETAIQRLRVEEIGAKAAVQRALRSLEASVGSMEPAEKERIRDHDSPPRLMVGLPDDWIRVALNASPTVAFARSQIDIAKAAHVRARAVQFPRVDAFANHALNDSDTVNTVDQKFETSTIGLQFSMPLYLGGAGRANLRQAKAQLRQAETDYEAAIATLTLEVQEAYDLAQVSHEQLIALNAAAIAAEGSVTAAQEAYRAGAESVSEVLAAQRQLRAVRSELITARYEIVLAYVRLNTVSGLLDEHVVHGLSDMFVTQSTVSLSAAEAEGSSAAKSTRFDLVPSRSQNLKLVTTLASARTPD